MIALLLLACAEPEATEAAEYTYDEFRDEYLATFCAWVFDCNMDHSTSANTPEECEVSNWLPVAQWDSDECYGFEVEAADDCMAGIPECGGVFSDDGCGSVCQ